LEQCLGHRRCDLQPKHPPPSQAATGVYPLIRFQAMDR
jgi:hypothetical protein